MCGRFTITMHADEITTLLSDAFAITSDFLTDKPRYNIAPTMETIAILHDGTKYRAGMIPWGFRFMRKETPILAFNTRFETIQEKPFFKSLFETQRLVFLSNGYFEWATQDKTPYWMHYKDQAPMFLGGLWRQDKSFQSSIITFNAPESLAQIHPRVPFSMPLEKVATWLKGANAHPETLLEVPTEIDPLSTRVNKPAHNDASILKITPPTVL